MITISYLFEQTVGKVNAPMFIWKVLHGAEPPVMTGMTYNDKKKQYKHVFVDKHLQTNVLDELNNISGIEIRSTCEGHDEFRTMHIIFRPINQDLNFVKLIVSKINRNKDVSCDYGVGNNGRYRIGVTTKMWYAKDKNKFKIWWNKIPNIIKKSLGD